MPTETPDDDSPDQIIIAPERMISSLKLFFNKEVDEDGYVIHADTGERVLAVDGEEIRYDDIGHIGPDENGDPEFVRDHISDIVSYISENKDNDHTFNDLFAGLEEEPKQDPVVSGNMKRGILLMVGVYLLVLIYRRLK